jgi:hypothetical protein
LTARSHKPASRDTVAYWRHKCERLQPYEDAVIAFSEIPVTYLTVLGACEHVARFGLQRGTSGQTWMHPGARALVDAEKRALARRGKALIEKLDDLVGESVEEGWQPVVHNQAKAAHSKRSSAARLDPDGAEAA